VQLGEDEDEEDKGNFFGALQRCVDNLGHGLVSWTEIVQFSCLLSLHTSKYATVATIKTIVVILVSIIISAESTATSAANDNIITTRVFDCFSFLNISTICNDC